MVAEREREICTRAVNKWGCVGQLGVAIEEASELIKAISKVLRNDVDPSDMRAPEIRHLAEECADVEIMLTQIRMMIGDQIVDGEKQRKLTRLTQLLDASDTDIVTPSTVHMTPEERRAGIQQMMADLEQLARIDGCIAAAWAIEAIEELKTQRDTAERERDKLRQDIRNLIRTIDDELEVKGR